MRVLHIINGEFYSGAERVQDLLGQHLPRLGFDVEYACLKPRRFPVERQSKNTPLYELPMKSRVDLTPMHLLRGLIHSTRYCLIHTHTPRTCLIGRIGTIGAGIPIIHHVHSPTLFDTAEMLRNLTNTITERCSLLGVQGIITVSESLKSYVIRQGIPRRKVFTVHNGVPSRKQFICRARPKGPWVLGTVGLFRPRKGIDVLLQALSRLKAKKLDVRLVLVGPFETVEYENQIQQLAERLDIAECVKLTGFVNDVEYQLDRLDLFVLPSLFGEGLPMVVIEALAAGLPVVASRVEGVPEVIRQEREGILVKPGSPSELANALERIIQGDLDWAALRKHAQRRQSESFSDMAMAQGVADVYRRVLCI